MPFTKYKSNIVKSRTNKFHQARNYWEGHSQPSVHTISSLPSFCIHGSNRGHLINDACQLSMITGCETSLLKLYCLLNWAARFGSPQLIGQLVSPSSAGTTASLLKSSKNCTGHFLIHKKQFATDLWLWCFIEKSWKDPSLTIFEWIPSQCSQELWTHEANIRSSSWYTIDNAGTNSKPCRCRGELKNWNPRWPARVFQLHSALCQKPCLEVEFPILPQCAKKPWGRILFVVYSRAIPSSQTLRSLNLNPVRYPFPMSLVTFLAGLATSIGTWTNPKLLTCNASLSSCPNGPSLAGCSLHICS